MATQPGSELGHTELFEDKAGYITESRNFRHEVEAVTYKLEMAVTVYRQAR